MAPNTADDLLSQSAEEILSFVRKCETAIELASDFNWHLIAEVTASRANRACERQTGDALTWAVVAVTIYDRLANTGDPQARQTFGLSAMMLRSNMIMAFGPVSGDIVLDPQIVENWFFRELEISLEEAKRLIDQKERLPADEMFRLIDLLNRAETLSVLQGKELIRRSNELKSWQEILKELR